MCVTNKNMNLFLRLRETHNALQLPVFIHFLLLLFATQRYPEYQEIRSKKHFTDHRTANTIDSFRHSVQVLKKHDFY